MKKQMVSIAALAALPVVLGHGMVTSPPVRVVSLVS